MTTLRDMLARRETIRTEFRAIQVQTPQGDLPADAQTRWTALETELRSLDAATARQATLDDLDRRSGVGVSLAGADTRFDELRAGVGLLDAIRAQMPGANDAAAGRAREVSQELARRSGRKPEGMFWSMRTAPIEQRVTTAVVAPAVGAPLVATMLDSANFIDRLRNSLVVRRLGARIMGDLVGNIDVPTRTGSVTAGWVAENQQVTASDQAFGKVSLRPHHAGALTILSRNMIQQATPDAEMLAQDDMSKVLAELLDAAALVGTGTNNQPLGIVPQIPAANASTYSHTGLPSWLNVLGLMTALDVANVTNPIAFVEASGMRATLMNITKATVSSAAADFVQNDPNVLAGAPAVTSHLLPAGSLLAGDFSDVLIGFWSELDILVNPYADSVYGAGNVAVRAMMTCDVQLRHPASFALLTQATS